jgi:hypothetical protein
MRNAQLPNNVFDKRWPIKHDENTRDVLFQTMMLLMMAQARILGRGLCVIIFDLICEWTAPMVDFTGRKTMHRIV